MTQPRAFGHRVSPLRSKVLAHSSARSIVGASRGLAPSASTSQHFEVGDQGPATSCVAFALSRAIKVRAGMLGVEIETPSELAIFFVARALERALSLPENFPPDGQLPKLADAGSDPVLAAQGVVDIGACGASAWPYDAARALDEAADGVLERLPTFTLRGCHPALETGPQGAGLNPAEVQQALASAYPFPMAIQVDEAFEDYGPDSPPLEAADPKTIPTNPDGSLAGGHMTLLLDYGQEKQWIPQKFWLSPRGDALLFRGGNSWGKNWGNGGLYFARPSFIMAPTTSDGFILDAVPGVVQAAVDRHMVAEQARHDAKAGAK